MNGMCLMDILKRTHMFVQMRHFLLSLWLQIFRQSMQICGECPTFCLILGWKVSQFFWINKIRVIFDSKIRFELNANHLSQAFHRFVALHRNRWFCAREWNKGSLQGNACLRWMSKNLVLFCQNSGQNRLTISFLNCD